jgi:hypothetical protein
VAAHLIQPPINALRLTLHPDGLAPKIANLGEWREHVLRRLRRQVELTADQDLIELLGELSEYAKAMAKRRDDRCVGEQVVGVAFRIHTVLGLLSFFTTTTIFGTPLDVTLSELALECFYPADAATAELVRNNGRPAKTAEPA